MNSSPTIEATDIIDISTREPEVRHTIGMILIEEGFIAGNDVDKIQRFARSHGIKFGAAAVQLNVAKQEDVDFALARQFDYPILARGGVDGVADSVVAAHNPQSAALEPLRVLRSQLLLRWRNVAPRGTLAVISPEPGEGRSWLAANLATVFAQAGQRTLLIDADLRQPSQHRLFNLENSVGLSTLLTGRTEGRDVVRRIHPQLKLFVLPAGLPPPNPQELLLRPLFESVLDRFAQAFNVIVLDSPAATVTSDAQIISARAGAALLLSRRNRTRVAGLVDTMRCLVDTGVQVLGSVVNEY
jgi:protein-tyrosine kinase